MRDRRVPWYLTATAVLVGIYLVAPLLIVIPLSFTGSDSFAYPPRSWSLDYYVKFFTDPVWQEALRNSIVLAVGVTVLSTVLGTLASFGIERTKFWARGSVKAILLLPMVVPGIVVAVAVYAVFLKLNLVGNFFGILLAHSMLALPFVIVAVTASLGSFDRRLEHAAAVLGANRWISLVKVTLPLILPGILSGAVFAFVTSFDEVVIALYLQSPQLRTLPIQMFTSIRLQIDPTIAAASTVIVIVTSAAILLPQLLRKAVPRD